MGFIRIKSQTGKNSWPPTRRKSSCAAGFTAMKRTRKKKRNSISRSESCRWNWTGCKKSPGSCDADRETRMHRTGPPKIEHHPAVRTDRAAAIELVLRAAAGDGGKPASDALVGRAIHAHAILRKPAHGDCAGRARLEGQSQTCPGAYAEDGHPGDLSKAAFIRSCARTSDLSIPAARPSDHAAQPSVGNRYYVHPAAQWIHLSGRHSRLVQPLRCGLGSLHHVGHRLLSVRAGSSFGESQAGNLQFRSRRTVHQRGIHKTAGERRRLDQHGWTGTRDGQYLHRAVVAKREVRRGLLERLRGRAGRDCKFEKLFSPLQFPAAAPVVAQSNARRDLLRDSEQDREVPKTGRAPGRLGCRSSFVGHPGTKFFPPARQKQGCRFAAIFLDGVLKA